MPDDPQQSFAIPPDVLAQQLPENETIFLNLATEEYFGLDSVGTAMYKALVECGTVEAAHERLRLQFEVEAGVLRRDLDALLQTLLTRGLLTEHGT